ncbi:MAG: ribosome biogenesis GTPase Der [Acidobacteriota bacterium]
MFSVVIIGRPNVGKSTLFNRILGRRKALVHNLPGVTRDLNYELVVQEDKVFQLVDTGGILGNSVDPMAALVEEQVDAAIQGGDKILLVVDGAAGLLPVEREIARKLMKAGKDVTLVVNKVDVEQHQVRSVEFWSLGIEHVFSVSAEHGGGVLELMDHVLEHAPPQEETLEDAGAVRIAVVGRPNVGKSSLANRLLGQDRSLVSDTPGTTRDPIDTAFRYDNKNYVLVDTAGIRRKSRTDKGAEVLSVLMARRAVSSCHVAVLVLDASRPVSHQDAHIAGLVEGSRKAAVFVLNKWDLVKGEEQAAEVEADIRERMAFCDWPPYVKLSARTGRRVDRLLPAVEHAYSNFSRSFPTSTLNDAFQDITARVSPPAVQGKEFKIRYVTQTGAAPPILTIFTNTPVPPPRSYTRYIKNRLREIFPLEGSPLILKYRRQ